MSQTICAKGALYSLTQEVLTELSVMWQMWSDAVSETEGIIYTKELPL